MSHTFKYYLCNQVKGIAARENLSFSSAFLFWFAANILELGEDETREAISMEGANDKGIDLFWVDDEEGRVFIAQGKYSPDLSFNSKVTDITKLESSLNWLANPEALRRDGKADLAQAAEDYGRAMQDGYGTELWYIACGPKCPNVEKHIGVYNQNPDNISSRRAERYYHSDLLIANWEELRGSSRRIPSEEIATANGEMHEFQGSFGRALIANIPAAELVRLYNQYGDQLFERNVRLFLGMRKGSVNAGIAETLSDRTQRANFWAYNNGVTFICGSYKIENSGITLTNFSIVNGCQTTVLLAQGLSEEDKRVCVLARFIAASNETIVDDVIRFNNSQNPIRTWDIASQDKTQRRLKREIEKLRKPYIYVTRRGSRPKGGLKAYREKGKLRQIRIDQLGQYAAAFRGDPVLAYKHKAFIFSKHHDTVFPPDVKVEEVLFQWICGEICREAVKTAISEKKEDEVRILKKGGTLFVLAAMSKIAALRNGATYLKSITETRISSGTATKRLRKYAEYARDKYVQAVLDQVSVDKQELPTLIRSREFYQKVIDRIERAYNSDARAAKWLAEALPKLY